MVERLILIVRARVPVAAALDIYEIPVGDGLRPVSAVVTRRSQLSGVDRAGYVDTLNFRL